MRRTFMDEGFREWEAYVSAGAPNTGDAARVVFVCISSPDERPRVVRHPSGDPVEAEHQLHHIDEDGLVELFDSSQPLP
jgi:hypothetical protein